MLHLILTDTGPALDNYISVFVIVLYFMQYKIGSQANSVCESVDWNHLAQDRDKWRVLVNTVMNLEFL
jgi:hypothetical protein